MLSNSFAGMWQLRADSFKRGTTSCVRLSPRNPSRIFTKRKPGVIAVSGLAGGLLVPVQKSPLLSQLIGKKFTFDRTQTIRVHVTADERYELFLDGKRIGRGSERGDRNNWFYELMI